MRAVPALIMVGAALLAAGCGGNDGQPTEAPARATVRPAADDGAERASRAVVRRCRRQMSGFLDVLDALRNQLAVGMSYDGYLGLVRDARGVHEEVPGDRLGFACLTRVGTPAEAVLNDYIEGVNAWGECLSESGCEEADVEPGLQEIWGRASRRLSQAEGGLRAL